MKRQTCLEESVASGRRVSHPGGVAYTRTCVSGVSVAELECYADLSEADCRSTWEERAF
jgi:hypothetical protein